MSTDTYRWVLRSADGIFSNYLLNVQDPSIDSALRAQMHSMQAVHKTMDRGEQHITALALIATYGKTLLQLARPKSTVNTHPPPADTPSAEDEDARQRQRTDPAHEEPNDEQTWQLKCFHCNRIGAHDGVNCNSRCHRCKGNHPGIKCSRSHQRRPTSWASDTEDEENDN